SRRINTRRPTRNAFNAPLRIQFRTCVDDTPSAHAASSIPYTNLASSSFSIILCLLSPQL
ncbi:MAG: hypothetical protein N2324_12475, partial [Thermus sp.]